VHGLTNGHRTAIGLFLTGDHAKQRGFTSTVRADDADDAARRQLESEVFDQNPVTIGLCEVFRLDNDAAQTLGDRDNDLRVTGTAILC